MAKSTESPLHTIIRIELVPGQEPAEVSIFCDTPEELLDTVARLTGRQPIEQAQAAPTQPVAQAQPGPSQSVGPTPTGAATPTAQQPNSEAAPAQPAAAGNSAGATATPLTAQDVLPDARELLQTQGEEALMGILAANGQQSVSNADPAAFPGILQGIRQALGKA